MYTHTAYGACLDYFSNRSGGYDFYLDNAEKIKVEHFWSQMHRRNNSYRTHLNSKKQFEKTLDSIRTLISSSEPINLSKGLHNKNAYSLLLFLLSTTESGRSLISTLLPYLNGQKAEYDGLHLHFYLKKYLHHGETDYFTLDEDTAPHVSLNYRLKRGAAIVVFAHELTHLMNHANIKISQKIKNSNELEALDEVIAFKVEQFILNKLLIHKSFQNYSDLFKNDDLNSIYGLSDKEIEDRLAQNYGLPRKIVRIMIQIFNEN